MSFEFILSNSSGGGKAQRARCFLQSRAQTQENSHLHTCACDLPWKTSPSRRRSQHITYLHCKPDYEGTLSDHPKPRALKGSNWRILAGGLYVLSDPTPAPAPVSSPQTLLETHLVQRPPAHLPQLHSVNPAGRGSGWSQQMWNARAWA